MIKIGKRGRKKEEKRSEDEKIFKLDNKLSLDAMIGVAKEVQDRSYDVIIDREEMVSKLEQANYYLDVKGEGYCASNLAVNQLCRLYDVPKKVVNSLLDKSVNMGSGDDIYMPMQNLANDLLNKQLEAEGELETGRRMLVRAMKDDPQYVRAILSDKFHPMDNYPLLEACKNVIRDNYVINAAFIDDEVMVVRLFFKDNIEVANQKLAVGVEIRNSEVGTYSLQIRIIVSAAEFGSYILTSTPIIRLKHTTKNTSMWDIAMELEEISTTMKETIEEKVRLLFLDDNLNTKSIDSFLASMKDIVKKEEFNQISQIAISKGKIHFLKGMYSIVYDSDYEKLDKIEREVTRNFFGELHI